MHVKCPRNDSELQGLKEVRRLDATLCQDLPEWTRKLLVGIAQHVLRCFQELPPISEDKQFIVMLLRIASLAPSGRSHFGSSRDVDGSSVRSLGYALLFLVDLQMRRP
mmetsp:Transcript_7833/g.8550  ORF Transcript_7833/g.8550 Transcript_7833/m.8550 type:complete len:108 (-) Transcript_7833:70-393(-)